MLFLRGPRFDECTQPSGARGWWRVLCAPAAAGSTTTSGVLIPATAHGGTISQAIGTGANVTANTAATTTTSSLLAEVGKESLKTGSKEIIGAVVKGGINAYAQSKAAEEAAKAQEKAAKELREWQEIEAEKDREFQASQTVEALEGEKALRGIAQEVDNTAAYLQYDLGTAELAQRRDEFAEQTDQVRRGEELEAYKLKGRQALFGSGSSHKIDLRPPQQQQQVAPTTSPKPEEFKQGGVAINPLEQEEEVRV